MEEKNAARRPTNVNHVEAASIPTAASTALRDHAGAASGQGVLISGAYGGLGYVFRAFALGALPSDVGPMFMDKVDNGDLDVLREMIEAGKLRPTVDTVFPLEETRQALDYLGAGQVKGKIGISVCSS